MVDWAALRAGSGQLHRFPCHSPTNIHIFFHSSDLCLIPLD